MGRMYMRIVNESGNEIVTMMSVERLPEPGETFEDKWIVTDRPISNARKELSFTGREVLVSTVTVRKLNAPDKNSPRERQKVMESNDGGVAAAGRDSKRFDE